MVLFLGLNVLGCHTRSETVTGRGLVMTLVMTLVQVTSELGPVDILVNNAGIVTGQKFLDCPDSLVVKTMQVNTLSHFWVRVQCLWLS